MLQRIYIFFCFLTLMSFNLHAAERHLQFENDKVKVWETVIPPGNKQILKMHNHKLDRVVVALSSGILEVKNDKDKVHLLKLTKNKAYFLPKDVANELHSDKNLSSHVMKVLVIELK